MKTWDGEGLDEVACMVLHQPYASLLMHVGKDGGRPKVHETRPRPLWKLQGRRVLVCAGKARPRWSAFCGTSLDRLCRGLFGKRWLESLPFGSALGVVRFAECVPADRPVNGLDRMCGDWGSGRWAIRTEDPVPLAAPVPVVGRQGVFYLDVSPILWKAAEFARANREAR